MTAPGNGNGLQMAGLGANILENKQESSEGLLFLSSDFEVKKLEIRNSILLYIALSSSKITISNTEAELINLINPLTKLGISLKDYIGSNNQKIDNLLLEYGELGDLGNFKEGDDVTIEGIHVSDILDGLDEVIHRFITSFVVRVDQIIQKRKMISELDDSKVKIIQLENLLNYDYLTKANNKRSFDTLLGEAYYLFENDKLERVTVMLIDLDKFKFTNDTFGHGAGDYVLKRFSKLMNEYAKKHGGEFFRIGGEEFGFIFPNKTSQEVADIGEKIQEEVITSLALEDEKYGTDCHNSITAGITTIDKTNRDKFEKAGQLTKKADNGTYIGKRLGRAQVVINNGNPEQSGEIRQYKTNNNEIDISKIIKGVGFYLPELLVAMFGNQTEIINKNEPIFNLNLMVSAHRNQAYLLYKILEEKGYGDYEWMKIPLLKFLGKFLEINKKIPVFKKIDALFDSGKVGEELKEEVMRSKKYKHCPHVDGFLEYIFS